MIIQCTNCNKNFEVNASLIPENGRNIQCGSCNHTWFYKHINRQSNPIDQNNKEEEITNINVSIEDEQVDFNQIQSEHNELDEKKDLLKKNISTNLLKKNKSTNFNLGKLLSYILVVIISCVAFVILLDTLKSPLSNVFPDLEFLLYNLFESIEDLFLFFKNLLL